MTIDTLKQAELNQVKNLEEKYGKSMEEWKQIVNNSGLEKHGELVKMLKEKYDMTHGYANLLVHYTKETHAGAVEDQDSLVTDQYKGKENMKPWYDELIARIKGFGNDVELAPKKAYVSVRRKKQFAIIQPSTKTRMDIGLNMKGQEPEGKLEAAGSWNSMCTHRIKVETESDLDEKVYGWLRTAYEQAG